MRSAQQFEAAKRLMAAGLNDCAVARQLDIPRSTVREWRCYPQAAIVDRCREAINMFMSGQRAAVRDLPKNCVEVSLYSKHWPCLLPQHGPGKKHHSTNRSEDIMALFTVALDKLDIPWTRSSKYIVSIYRKAATARLDEFVGPKAVAVPLNGVHYTA
ncbi:hypothetical protein MHOL44478_06365 [Mycobacterium holsaticum DSM 44478]|nr:hypothetical protein [Mycolicibacterium holsaticum DSM 44478 = JCM 12374]